SDRPPRHRVRGPRVAELGILEARALGGPGPMHVPASLWTFTGVIAALVASMVPYAASGPRRDRDQRTKGGQLLAGAGGFVLDWFMWLMEPLTAASIRAGLTPDVYNYLGLLLGLGAGVLIGLGRLEWAGWAIASCGVADILDGRIARQTGVASGYGDFIDSTFDRFVEVVVFLGFAGHLRAFPLGPLLSGAAMGGSLLVSYTRARGEVLGVLCTGGLMQRGERLVLTCLVCLLDPGITALARWRPGTLVMWALGAIVAGTLITAVHRTFWIA